jgi:hypothetical protein
MIEEMPEKTAEELQTECLRLLRANASTRDVTFVGIIAINTSKTGPNWTYGEIRPPLTALGIKEAHKIIASVAGGWALKL